MSLSVPPLFRLVALTLAVVLSVAVGHVHTDEHGATSGAPVAGTHQADHGDVGHGEAHGHAEHDETGARPTSVVTPTPVVADSLHAPPPSPATVPGARASTVRTPVSEGTVLRT